MGKKPGFMVYYDMMDILDLLSGADLKRMLKAAMAYSRTGEEPQMSGKLARFWKLFRDRLDLDDQAYREKCRKKAYAAYCRGADGRGEKRLTYEDWSAQVSDDSIWHQTQPTTTATATTTTTTTAATAATTTTTTTTCAAGAAEGSRTPVREKEKGENRFGKNTPAASAGGDPSEKYQYCLSGRSLVPRRLRENAGGVVQPDPGPSA